MNQITICTFGKGKTGFVVGNRIIVIRDVRGSNP